MLKINGTNYKLCFIDTCIISQVLRDNHFAQEILKKIENEKWFLVISLYNIIEIKKTNDENFITKFFDLFNTIPCIVFKNYNQLLRLEIENFRKNINPSELSIQCFGTGLNRRMEDYFCTTSFEKFEKEYNLEETLILESIINNVSQGRDVSVFKYVKDSTFLRVARENASFIERTIAMYKNGEVEKKEEVEKYFPSVRMTNFSIYYKFINDKRNPELSDVRDIIMTSLFPYVDIVLIERQQAEMLRQVKKKDDIVRHLQIYKRKGSYLEEVL